MVMTGPKLPEQSINGTSKLKSQPVLRICVSSVTEIELRHQQDWNGREIWTIRSKACWRNILLSGDVLLPPWRMKQQPSELLSNDIRRVSTRCFELVLLQEWKMPCCFSRLRGSNHFWLERDTLDHFWLICHGAMRLLGGIVLTISLMIGLFPGPCKNINLH